MAILITFDPILYKFYIKTNIIIDILLQLY